MFGATNAQKEETADGAAQPKKWKDGHGAGVGAGSCSLPGFCAARIASFLDLDSAWCFSASCVCMGEGSGSGVFTAAAASHSLCCALADGTLEPKVLRVVPGGSLQLLRYVMEEGHARRLLKLQGVVPVQAARGGGGDDVSQPGPLGLFAAPEARRHRPRVPLSQADLIR